MLEPIKGLWECHNRCGLPNLNSRRSIGSWLLDPLISQSSGLSIMQTITQHRAGRRPRRFRNATLEATTAKLDSRHGNISAAFRVVGESAMFATATIRSTTRSGNIVLELVSQSQIDKWRAATCQRCPCLTSRYRSPSPPRGWSISTYILGRVSSKPNCLLVYLNIQNGGAELAPY